MVAVEVSVFGLRAMISGGDPEVTLGADVLGFGAVELGIEPRLGEQILEAFGVIAAGVMQEASADGGAGFL